ncbi:MAG: hypothetical protein AAF806_22595 [Bacteroidota bacterium]
MKYISFSAILLLILSIVGCQMDNSNTEDTKVRIEVEDEEGKENIEIDINDEGDLFDALHSALDKVEAELDDAADKLDKDNRVEATDYEDLKSELPLMISGMLRSDAKGERSGIGKFKVSSATAKYETDDRRLKLTITDTGNVPFAKLGYKIFSKADIVHESDDEYARTTEIEGFPAYEVYDKNSENGSVTVIVNDRVIVHAEGSGVSENNLKRAIEKVDLKGLAKL